MDHPTDPPGSVALVRQEIVTFYEDSIPVVLAADGHLYAALRPITDALDLDEASP